MLKKTITFMNYDNEEVTKDYYFNFTKPELMRMFANYGGDAVKYFQYLAEEKDSKKMIAALEDVILSAYGERTPDGDSFMKTPEIRAYFENSIAYAELFEELLTDENSLVKFIEGTTSGIKPMKEPAVSMTVVGKPEFKTTQQALASIAGADISPEQQAAINAILEKK